MAAHRSTVMPWLLWMVVAYPASQFAFAQSRGMVHCLPSASRHAIASVSMRGVLVRERVRWSVLRPRCALSDVTQLDYVSMRQVIPILSFLIVGLFVSTSMMGAERLYHANRDR